MGTSTVHALRGVDFQVRAREFLAVMGPSGSGKSTLLHLLGCLDRPDQGEVRVDGIATAELDDRALSRLRNRRLGFVFQSFHLIPRLTVLENVAVPLLYQRVPAREADERAWEAVRMVGLEERATHLPSQLSGGERQRVAIARALVNDPALVLADEPTGNLDSRTGREIMRTLQALHERGRTLVVVTHNADVATYATRVVVIEDGRITPQA